MAYRKFSKGYNPNRRRTAKKLDRTEREIIAIKGMLTDSKLGYTVPAETYVNK